MVPRSAIETVFEILKLALPQGKAKGRERGSEPAIEKSPHDRLPSAPTCGVSLAGLQLIKTFEGCARLRPDGMYEAYPDPGTGGDPWTIGWGATGSDITEGTVWSKSQCDERLERDVARHAEDVTQALGDAPTSQGQFDALVSFHFNTGAIRSATLTRLHRAGDFAAAAAEFGRWKYAGGRVLKGLVRRRRAEATLYRT